MSIKYNYNELKILQCQINLNLIIRDKYIKDIILLMSFIYLNNIALFFQVNALWYSEALYEAFEYHICLEIKLIPVPKLSFQLLEASNRKLCELNPVYLS